ncbi:PQQ-dependent sugar dehydrogenase [Aeribacillus pallidus]|uniref:PQQ-dependent sugar dehydrogenase n=1 Tax=Aeribacillus pallidus TaxID=33936 RepID=UPI003D245520
MIKTLNMIFLSLFLFFLPLHAYAQPLKRDLPNDILRNGSRGEGVKILQQALNDIGYSLKVDGIYGNLTESAVKDFQKQNHLTIDGIYGPMTKRALEKKLAEGGTDPNHPSYQIVAKGLNIPWSLDIYKGTFYVTERSGNLVTIKDGKVVRHPMRLSKPIKVYGEGGLLGFVLDPNFGTNQTAYLYHTYEAQGKIYNRVISVKLSGSSWIEQKELVAGIPGGRTHNGGRIAIGPDKKLYVTTGEAGVPALAQDVKSLAGKILRMNLDGTIPIDNPFPDSYIYSYGHRNPQGLTWDQGGQLYSSEHGPSGENGWRAHDEINKILPGKNYGWPLIIGNQKKDGMESPLFQSGNSTWAPSGLAYYNGALYVAGLKGAQIRKFNLSNKQETVVLSGLGRLRNITFDGNTAYVLTNNRLLKGKSDDWMINIHGL